MKPIQLHRIEPDRRRFHHAQARIRTLLVAAVCLLIGMGLGAFWHSRRAQRVAAKAEGTAPVQDVGTLSAGTTAVLQRLQWPVQIKPDPAIAAEVMRRIPNFASVSLEEGSRILREAALKDLRAALSQMEDQVKAAEQRAEEAKSETEKQAALKELQRLQAQQAATLSECTTRSSAQIEALRQLQGQAR